MIRLALPFAVALCVASTALAEQTQPTLHLPMNPIGPTSEAQCQRLAQEWTSVCDQIYTAHQSCLDANRDMSIKPAGECSKAPCLTLHVENASCGSRKSEALSSCNAQVRAHLDREAEFRRAQEAAVRAQQQAERERRERLQQEAARYSAEARLARQRAEAYRRAMPRQRDQDAALTASQASTVDGLRDQADRLADGIRDGAGRLGDAVSGIDLSEVSASAGELLRHEGVELLTKTLQERGWTGELYESFAEEYEIPIAIAESLPSLVNGALVVRARLRGELPDGDWNIGLDAVEAVSNTSFTFSGVFPRLAPTGQVGNVVSGVRESFSFASSYLQEMVHAFVQNRPFVPAEDFSSGFVTRLVGGVMPIDTIRRLDNLASDSGMTWRRETNKFFEMFR